MSTLESTTLAGQTALVTGAAGLLGREHAAALLELGARTVLTDVSVPALEDAKRELDADFDPARVVT
ncbi:MAG: SDR family NAD(P)-dependent oxidoreductase, partial [Planctomycetota bacterium]